jgi:hypothetical protein
MAAAAEIIALGPFVGDNLRQRLDNLGLGQHCAGVEMRACDTERDHLQIDDFQLLLLISGCDNITSI